MRFIGTVIEQFTINAVLWFLPLLFVTICVAPPGEIMGPLVLWLGWSFLLAIIKALNHGASDYELN